VEGSDQPPTLLVGITVITRWTQKGAGKSFSEYTRIADSRGLVTQLSSHAKAEALRISSTGSGGNALLADVAQVEADGTQSTGSTASVSASALEASDNAVTGSPLSGSPANAVSVSPGATSGSGTGNSVTSSGSGCGWVSAGKSSVSDVTSSVTGGLPTVPADLDSASPPANQAAADLVANGTGCSGNTFSFANQSSAYDATLGLPATNLPLVTVPGATSGVPVHSSAWLAATDPLSPTRSVTSGSSVAMSQPVLLFPGTTLPNGTVLPFVASIQVTSSTISCSAATANGALTLGATASYTAVVRWYEDLAGNGAPTVQSQTVSWSSGSATADPLPGLLTRNVYNVAGVVRPLSTWINWTSARKVTESTASGVHGIDSVVHVTTAPVRGVAEPLSSLGLDLAGLSCVAEDNR
jgi:hypothetical protein